MDGCAPVSQGASSSRAAGPRCVVRGMRLPQPQPALQLWRGRGRGGKGAKHSGLYAACLAPNLGFDQGPSCLPLWPSPTLPLHRPAYAGAPPLSASLVRFVGFCKDMTCGPRYFAALMDDRTLASRLLKLLLPVISAAAVALQLPPMKPCRPPAHAGQKLISPAQQLKAPIEPHTGQTGSQQTPAPHGRHCRRRHPWLASSVCPPSGPPRASVISGSIIGYFYAPRAATRPTFARRLNHHSLAVSAHPAGRLPDRWRFPL